VTLLFTICAIRTNVILFTALLLLVVAFGALTGSYFHLALGNVALAGRLQVVRLSPLPSLFFKHTPQPPPQQKPIKT
jgi:hypothetical protein